MHDVLFISLMKLILYGHIRNPEILTSVLFYFFEIFNIASSVSVVSRHIKSGSHESASGILESGFLIAVYLIRIKSLKL